MKYKSLLHTVVVLSVLSVAAGCKNTLASFDSKPTALGKTSEIVLICDTKLWDGEVGDSILYYYESPYPIMPQPEPLFDLRHFTAEQLYAQALRKELRTYLIIGDMSDEDSPATKMIMNDLGPEKMRRFAEDPGYFSTVGQDKWARGQLLIYVLGKNQDDLIAKLIKAFPTIAQRVKQHDLVQVHASTYLDGESFKLKSLISEKFHFDLRVPGDYQKAVDQNNFLWIRKDTREYTNSIAIRTFPYTDKTQLELDGLINMRNRLGLLVEGSSVGSFMQTNATDLPVYTYQKELGGRYTVESRGIWELTEDYLGGPFLNYAVVVDDKIIMIDCFVYAPGKLKRKYIQQLEHIVSTVTFDETGD